MPVPVDKVLSAALITVPEVFAAAIVAWESTRSEVTSVGQLVPLGAPSVALPTPTVIAEPPVNEKFVLPMALYQFAVLSFVLLFENRNCLPEVALSMMAYT